MSSDRQRPNSDLMFNFWLAPRRFRPNSPLRVYLDAKYPCEFYLHPQKTVSLYSTVKAVLEVAEREKLQCQNNAMIIICNASMQTGLKTNCFHRHELQRFILRQLMWTVMANEIESGASINIVQEISIRYDVANPIPALPSEIELHHGLVMDIHYNAKIKVTGKFCARNRALRHLLKIVPHFALDQDYAADYEMWMTSLISYLMHFRSSYFSRLNQNVIFTKHRQLGSIFRVDAIHVSQLSHFLLKNLIDPADRQLSTDLSDDHTEENVSVLPLSECLNCKSYTNLIYCDPCWRVKQKYRQKKPRNQEEEDAALCCLCLDAKCDTVFVHQKSCHYISCYECATLWWEKTPNKTCPKCRKPVLSICKLYS